MSNKSILWVFSAFAALILGTMIMWAGSEGSFSKDYYKVYASNIAQEQAGTNLTVRTDAVLSVVTNRYKSKTISLVIDDGRWYVSNSIVFPTNIHVAVQSGSSLDTSNACSVTFLGDFQADQNQQIFYGDGTFLSPSMVISNPAWWGLSGSSVVLRVADNSITSAKIVDGTIVGADIATNTITSDRITNGTITSNDIAAGGINESNLDSGITTKLNAITSTNANNNWTGTNTFGDVNITGKFLNISNDMAASFMGYPKVALTTNMLSSYSSGGTIITLPSFTNAFDNSNLTSTDTGTQSSSLFHSFSFDLGAKYEGYIRIRSVIVCNISSTTFQTTWGQSQSPMSGIGASMNQFRDYDILIYQTGTFTNTTTIKIDGRYFAYSFAGDAGMSSASYSIQDVSLYAITNSYRNMGGF